MLDLAARVYYKAHFDIVRETDTLDILRDVIVADLSDWLKRKYRGAIRYWNWAQFSEYGNFDTENHRLIASTTSFKEENSRYWACKIEEFENSPDDEDDSVTTLKKHLAYGLQRSALSKQNQTEQLFPMCAIM